MRDRIRIAPHSAAHLDRRSSPPDAPVTLWTTREVERHRFHSADGRVDGSERMMAGNSRRTVALTDAPDFSPRWGQGRSSVSQAGPHGDRVVLRSLHRNPESYAGIGRPRIGGTPGIAPATAALCRSTHLSRCARFQFDHAPYRVDPSPGSCGR